MASHTLEEHTGEVRIRVEAASEEELFAEAGRALGELMGAARPPEPGEPYESVELDGRDREELLVAWLDELVFRTERSGRIYGDLRVWLHGNRLRAEIRGGEMTEPRTPVKAATLHGLRIERMREDGRVIARVVLDV
jgi:SHS2 domain-containing protein